MLGSDEDDLVFVATEWRIWSAEIWFGEASRSEEMDWGSGFAVSGERERESEGGRRRASHVWRSFWSLQHVSTGYRDLMRVVKAY